MLLENEEVYAGFAEKLFKRCQQLQIENERLVMRVNGIKKLARQKQRDVEILKRHLDKHNDNWRSVPATLPNPKRKIEQKRGPKPKKPQDPNDPTTSTTEKKVRRRRKKKVEANPPQEELLEFHTVDNKEMQESQTSLMLEEPFEQQTEDVNVEV